MEPIYKQDVERDIYFALEILNHNYNDVVQKNEYSQIPKEPRESINKYAKYMRRKNNVLVPTESGDLTLQSLVYGPMEVFTFDASNFPKYFLDLKLAAASKLDSDDLIKMFYSDDYEKNGSNNLYPLFKDKLQLRSRIFWDAILENYSWSQVYSSKLFTEDKEGKKHMDKKELMKQYSFLKPRNYRKLQRNAKRALVESFTCDLPGFPENINIFGRYYDLALLGDTPKEFLPENFVKHVKSIFIPRGLLVASYKLDDDKYKYADLFLENEGFTVKKAKDDSRLIIRRYR